MRAAARQVIAAATALALAGCAVVQPVRDLSPAAIRQQVRVGDVVHVAVTDGRTFELAVEKVEATSLTGTTLDQRRFRIAYASITELQVRSPGAAAAGTGMLVLGGLAAVVLVFAGFDWLGDNLFNRPE